MPDSGDSPSEALAWPPARGGGTLASEMHTTKWTVGLVIAVSAALAACGSSSDDGGPSTGGSGGAAGGGGSGGAVQSGTQIQIESGEVDGESADGVRAFRGIPYAEPPVGPRRFQAPEKIEPWSMPFDATGTPNTCPQLATGSNAFEGDEDCLTLNVWAPDPAPSAPLPTMVWIHGGAFTGGSAEEPTYEGDELVRTGNVVVVSMNYRLGPLGFLVHPALSGEAKNLGLRDQRLALEWVRDNVAAFGGDPKNVTIFGESAGGVSVCAHLTSSGSQGLFQRAISESGPCSALLPTLAQSEQQGADLAQAVGCTDEATAAECLRGKTAEELLKALPLKSGVFFGNGASWGPLNDGDVLSENPEDVILKQGASVPVIFGSNANEGDLFVYLAGLGTIGEPAYNTIAATFASGLGIPAQDLLDQYPAAAYPTPADALSDAIGDAGFVCPMRRAVRGITAHGGTAYLYHFTRAITLLGITKSFHGAELPFVFGKPLSTFTPDSPEDAALSKAMQGYWTAFAASADPGGTVAWPKYTETADEHLTLDHAIAVGSALKKDKCDFWDSI